MNGKRRGARRGNRKRGVDTEEEKRGGREKKRGEKQEMNGGRGKTKRSGRGGNE